MRFVRCTEVAAALLLFCGTAVAQEPCSDLRSEVADVEPELIEHDGVRGMFFPMPVARLVLCEVRELRVRRRESEVASREVELWRTQVSLLREQIDLAARAEGVLNRAIESAEQRAEQAEDAVNAWWRSPALWATVGAVLVVAAGLAIDRIASDG